MPPHRRENKKEQTDYCAALYRPHYCIQFQETEKEKLLAPPAQFHLVFISRVRPVASSQASGITIVFSRPSFLESEHACPDAHAVAQPDGYGPQHHASHIGLAIAHAGLEHVPIRIAVASAYL